MDLGKIYTEEEIERAKHSPSFDREYRCQFSGFIGNLFSPLQIDRVIELGEQYKAYRLRLYIFTVWVWILGSVQVQYCNCLH